MEMQGTTIATAAEVCRNFGLWQDRAMRGPVMVTNHGRPKTVLVSIDDFGREESGRTAAVGTVPPPLLDQMAQGFVTLDDRLAVTGANRVAQTSLQRDLTALRGAHLADLYPDLVASVMTRIFTRVLQTGDPTTFEVPSSAGAGQTVRVEAFAHEGGVGYLTTRIDDDLAIRLLAAEQDALDSLFSVHGAAGTARLNLRGAFVSVGKVLLEMLDFDADQLVHARLADLVPIGRRVSVNDAIDDVLRDGTPRALDTELMTRTGSDIGVTIALAPIRSAFSIEALMLLATPRRAV